MKPRALFFLLAAATSAALAEAPAADPVQVEFASGDLIVTQPQVLQSIHTAERSVIHYYGRYPVPSVKITVQPRPGRSGNSGTTYGGEDGAHIELDVGSEISNQDMQTDWVITHEMVHLAFPQMEREHHWIEEGIATYVEPIARAESGDLSVDYMWQETLEGMPKGLPREGDQGFDNTRSWGYTYWGGARFCLLADVEIRERTHNKYGLQDALRGILAAGGNINMTASLDYTLGVADKAVGVPVLEELYAQMKDKPVDTDLSALWKKLGVALVDGKIVYDDKAPDAAIRKAITSPDTQ